MTPQNTILIVDDENRLRLSLSLILQKEKYRVETAADAEDALDCLQRHEYDLMFLDLNMPGMSGIELLVKVHRQYPHMPVLILTAYAALESAIQAIRLGARGFLLKDISLERLAEAIRTVAAGGTLLQPAITERLLRAALGGGTGFDSSLAPEPLTEREIEVLRLMTGGFSNREIADSLGVAEGTAKNHISNILAKLGVRDRTRAVLKALELGLV